MAVAAPPRHPALRRAPLPRRMLRALRALVVAVVVLLVLGLALLRVADWRPLVVLTGSMEPAIAPGDIVLADAAPARRARVGDVVTFAAPDGSGRTITHRVRAIGPDPGRPDRLAVRTQGDANPAGERWSIERDGSLRIARATLPGTPALRGVLAGGATRGTIVGVVALLVLAVLLREIWRPAAQSLPRPVRRRW